MFYVSAFISNKTTVIDEKGKKVAMSVVPEWFEARRGLALGLASSGTSIGSFIMPLIMTSLNQSLGAPWYILQTYMPILHSYSTIIYMICRCYRILGLIMLVSGTIATLMFREHGENKEKKATAATKERPTLGEIFQFDLLKSPTFLLWCLTDIFMEGAYYVPFFYLPCKAIVYVNACIFLTNAIIIIVKM